MQDQNIDQRLVKAARGFHNPSKTKDFYGYKNKQCAALNLTSVECLRPGNFEGKGTS